MTSKSGVVFKHTHKETKEVVFHGVVKLGGGCKVVGPQHRNKGTALGKVEKQLRKLDIEVSWIGG